MKEAVLCREEKAAELEPPGTKAADAAVTKATNKTQNRRKGFIVIELYYDEARTKVLLLGDKLNGADGSRLMVSKSSLAV